MEVFDISEGEMKVISNIRETLLKATGKDVIADIAEIDEDSITVIYEYGDKMDIVLINRKTLQWTI